ERNRILTCSSTTKGKRGKSACLIWWTSRPGRSAESPGQRLPASVWKIHLLHGAQTRLVQNAAITGDAPGTLSRLGTERIQGQCTALLKITQEIPVGLQACHGGQRGKPGRGGPGILLRRLGRGRGSSAPLPPGAPLAS